MSPNRLPDSTYDCDTVTDLIPEYAFGLADADETNLVELQLASCPDAADQLADFRRIEEEMREGIPQLTPSARVEARLMAAIATPVHSAKPQRRPLRLSWLSAAAAVIALVCTNAYWVNRIDDLNRRIAEAPQTNNVSAQTGTQNNTQPNSQQNTAFVLTSTTGLRWVRLPPSEQNGNAAAFLMWNAESKIGLLYAHGFPNLVLGKTYQLWLTKGDEKTSAGTFKVDQDGNGALLFHITAPIDNYTWARITAEPGNGSQVPTGTPVVIGQITT